MSAYADIEARRHIADALWRLCDDIVNYDEQLPVVYAGKNGYLSITNTEEGCYVCLFDDKHGELCRMPDSLELEYIVSLLESALARC